MAKADMYLGPLSDYHNAHADLLERMCEASLVDPAQRGVLVHYWWTPESLTMAVTARLDSEVAFGLMEGHRADGDLCQCGEEKWD